MDELCGGKGQWNGLIGQINSTWRRVSYQTMYKLNVAQHHTNRNSYLQRGGGAVDHEDRRCSKAVAET